MARTDAEKIPNELIARLGVANLAGWIAYRIYDNFLDNDGKPELLSLANKSLRRATVIYMDILPRASHAIFHSVMKKMDESNAWERETSYRPTKIPDYKNYALLGYKSLPHCLGPLAILVILGYTIKNTEIKNCAAFFYHYLIARQLSDDALDWQKDLENGFVNSVAARLFIKIGKQWSPSYDVSELKQTFKNEIRLETIATINQHLAKAEMALKNNPAILYKEYLQSLLDSLKINTQKRES